MPDGGHNCRCMKQTFVTLIHPSTPAEWIASQAASLARTLARLEEEKVLPDQGRDYGRNTLASLAHYDPATHSLKTVQCSLFADSMSSSVTLPRWGTMRHGRLYPQPTLALRTSERGSGYWPTIRATDGERGCRGDLIQAVRGNANSHYRLWQTPVADDALERKDGKWNSRGEPKLSAQLKLWPTPTVCGNHNRKGASANSGDGLATAVARLPTPCSTDWKGSSKPGQRRGQLSETVAGGQLNPLWVEWLMGWPIGHTASRHWVTARSRSKRR